MKRKKEKVLIIKLGHSETLDAEISRKSSWGCLKDNGTWYALKMTMWRGC